MWAFTLKNATESVDLSNSHHHRVKLLTWHSTTISYSFVFSFNLRSNPSSKYFRKHAVCACACVRVCVCYVINATFNNISEISFYWWRKPEYSEKINDLSQVTDKLYHKNVVSRAPRMRGIRTHNFSGYMRRLHYYDHDGPFITRNVVRKFQNDSNGSMG